MNWFFGLPAIKTIDTLGRRKWLIATLPLMCVLMGAAAYSFPLPYEPLFSLDPKEQGVDNLRNDLGENAFQALRDTLEAKGSQTLRLVATFIFCEPSNTVPCGSH